MQKLKVGVEGSKVRERVGRLCQRGCNRVDRGREDDVTCGPVKRAVHPLEDRFVSTILRDGAADVEAADVLRALPDGVALRVAELARHRPVLHVAVSAKDFERLHCGAERFARCSYLGQRNEDPAQAAATVLGFARARRRRALERQGTRRLELDEEVDQRLAHERVTVDALTPLLSARRVDGGFEERPTVNTEAHHGDAKTAAVDHLHHARQAAFVRGCAFVRRRRRARVVTGGDPGARAVELHLGGRDRDRAELGLEALDVKPVRRTIGQPARHDERGEAPRAVGRAFGPGEHDEHVGVDVGAEVLLAVQPPLRAVRDRSGGVRADVAAALAFGEEHARFPSGVGVTAPQLGNEVVPHVGWRVALDDVGRSGGHAQTAVDRGLGLTDEVGQRRRDDRRNGAARVVGETHEARTYEIGLVGEPARVVDDLVDLAAPLVVTLEHRAALVAHLGPSGERAAAQVSVTSNVVLGEGPVLRVGKEPVEQAAEVRIERVPIEPDRLLVRRVVGKHVRSVAMPS